MKILDNITDTVRDDLRAEIKRVSKAVVAAACFSMYACQELRESNKLSTGSAYIIAVKMIKR